MPSLPLSFYSNFLTNWRKIIRMHDPGNRNYSNTINEYKLSQSPNFSSTSRYKKFESLLRIKVAYFKKNA